MSGSLQKMLLARTTEAGSRNLVWAGTEDMPTGSYVDSCQVSEYVPPILARSRDVLIRAVLGHPILRFPPRVELSARRSGTR